jgi:hypothetical protein
MAAITHSTDSQHSETIAPSAVPFAVLDPGGLSRNFWIHRIFVSRAGFEPTIPVFVQPNAINALDPAADGKFSSIIK